MITYNNSMTVIKFNWQLFILIITQGRFRPVDLSYVNKSLSVTKLSRPEVTSLTTQRLKSHTLNSLGQDKTLLFHILARNFFHPTLQSFIGNFLLKYFVTFHRIPRSTFWFIPIFCTRLEFCPCERTLKSLLKKKRGNFVIDHPSISGYTYVLCDFSGKCIYDQHTLYFGY